jgi:hypothetical protein
MKCKANEKPKSLAIHDVKIVIESVDLGKIAAFVFDDL